MTVDELIVQLEQYLRNARVEIVGYSPVENTHRTFFPSAVSSMKSEDNNSTVVIQAKAKNTPVCIWYKRPNKTVRELEHEWEAIEEALREEYENGNSYGMLGATIGEERYPMNVYAGKKSAMKTFFFYARAWHTELKKLI